MVVCQKAFELQIPYIFWPLMVHSHERFGIGENARDSIYTSDLLLGKTQETAFTRAICHRGKCKRQHLHERFVIGKNTWAAFTRAICHWRKRKRHHLHEQFAIGKNARDNIYTRDLSLAKIHEQHLHERFVIGENTRDSDCKWTCLGCERAKSIAYICYLYKQ